MNDLISRQTAIDALDEPCKVTNTWTDEFAVGERMQWEKDVKALNNLPSAQQWIPVTERLPEKDGPCLVSGNSEIWICEFIHIGILKGWSNPANRPRVKAWMPLPEPPKDGD